MEEEEEECGFHTQRPRFFLQDHTAPQSMEQRWLPFLPVSFASSVLKISNLSSMYVFTIYVINYKFTQKYHCPHASFRKHGHIYMSTVCQHNLCLMQSRSNLVSSNPRNWTKLVYSTIFGYENNLEGWIAFVPQWPCNSKGLLHRFTYSENKSNIRIHWCQPFLKELCECKALPDAVTLIHHTAVPFILSMSNTNTYQPSEVINNSNTQTKSPSFRQHYQVPTAEPKVYMKADLEISCFKRVHLPKSILNSNFKNYQENITYEKQNNN